MADSSEGATGAPDELPPVVDRTVPPGSDERADDVWALKERIKRFDGLLVQRRPFFDAQYRQSTCYLSVALGSASSIDGGVGNDASTRRSEMRPSVEEVVGFAIVTRDGYLSLIGVDPAYRRYGIGSTLLERAVDDFPGLTCHVRATNSAALGFYADRGFVVDGCVEGYYRDGTDAYRLVRDPDRAERLADVLS